MLGRAASRYRRDRVTVDHQRGSGFDRSLGYRDREIDAPVGLGEVREHREPRRGLGIVGQVNQKSLGVRRVAKLEKHPGGANYFVTVEPGPLRTVRYGLGHRPWWRIVPELMRCELTVEGGHVIGPGGVPFRREFGFALCIGGASSPITGSRLCIRGINPRQDAREMFEGQRRLLYVAQRDIAQEELGFGKRVSFDQAMLL